MGETIDFLSVTRTESIGVDKSFGEKMNINIDITFPSSACRCKSCFCLIVVRDSVCCCMSAHANLMHLFSVVYFDVVDSTGEEQLAVEDLKKITLVNKGKQDLLVNQTNKNNTPSLSSRFVVNSRQAR
jgi:hypothetical protein